MKTTVVLGLMLLSACAHRPTEREIFESGLEKGFRMGHAPQILPIQVAPIQFHPVSLTKGDSAGEAVLTAEEFLRSFDEPGAE